jgi:hypothetical protein
MSRSTSIIDSWPSAGIFLGPAAWVLNTQLSYAIVPWVCAHGSNIVPAAAIVGALIALAGCFLSWRAWTAQESGPSGERDGGRPHRFVAGMGTLMGVLFAAVILLQGVAGLVFQGCER